MTYLAVPISADSVEAAGRQIDIALAAGAQMLELRTDYLSQLSGDSVTSLIARARQSSDARVPVIVTCRDPNEGGARPWSEEARMGILLAAIEAGAEFIDCEYANFTRKANAEKLLAALSAHPRSRLILSAHDFKGPFRNFPRLYGSIQKACPEAIPKLVYTANHINDCFEAFDLLHETSGDRIVLCMGEPGLISRLLAKKLGGLVTFASLDEQAATAPGQLTIGTLKGLYGYDIINADTELFGVIGDPVGHSLSPAIHNACFAEKGMNKLYLPLHVQGDRKQFNKFLDAVVARPWLGFRGFSVTIPHKENAAIWVVKSKFCGPMDTVVNYGGAANTLVIERGPAPPPWDKYVKPGQSWLRTHNTDWTGALEAITQGMGIEERDLAKMPVAVVGAGGVARAIIIGLGEAGARVTIYNRTVKRAKNLVAEMEFDCEADGLEGLAHLDARLLINCTSVGMYPNVDATPVPAEYIKPDMTVFDTIYNPAETLLLKQAKARGAKTINGITMFVNQAAAQFQLFTGQPANTDLMRKVVVDSLGSR
jgi:3-dehydroquinate dehydratase/shikimate dehydrogenase